LAVVFLAVGDSALAVDAGTVCSTADKKPSASFNYWYTKYKTNQSGSNVVDGVTVICFDPAKNDFFNLSETLEIKSANDEKGSPKSLAIWGAKFNASNVARRPCRDQVDGAWYSPTERGNLGARS
jgi:hypothetical protein